MGSWNSYFHPLWQYFKPRVLDNSEGFDLNRRDKQMDAIASRVMLTRRYRTSKPLTGGDQSKK